jgi:hypothetical protein
LRELLRLLDMQTYRNHGPSKEYENSCTWVVTAPPGSLRVAAWDDVGIRLSRLL